MVAWVACFFLDIQPQRGARPRTPRTPRQALVSRGIILSEATDILLTQKATGRNRGRVVKSAGIKAGFAPSWVSRCAHTVSRPVSSRCSLAQLPGFV